MQLCINGKMKSGLVSGYYYVTVTACGNGRCLGSWSESLLW